MANQNHDTNFTVENNQQNANVLQPAGALNSRTGGSIRIYSEIILIKYLQTVP